MAAEAFVEALLGRAQDRDYLIRYSRSRVDSLEDCSGFDFKIQVLDGDQIRTKRLQVKRGPRAPHEIKRYRDKGILVFQNVKRFFHTPSEALRHLISILGVAPYYFRSEARPEPRGWIPRER